MLLFFGALVGLFDLDAKQYELSILAVGMVLTLAGVRYFSLERVVFWRECSSGLSIPAYYVGKMAAALPPLLFYPLVYLSLFYPMTFPRVPLAYYYQVLLLAGMVCFGVGVIMSLIFEPKNAQIAGVVVALVGFLFGGHNPDAKTLNKSFAGKFGMWLSYVRWSMGALTLQDAMVSPPCLSYDLATPSIRSGMVATTSPEMTNPATFNPDMLYGDVNKALKMLVVLTVLYFFVAMAMMYLAGKSRARMLSWAYIKGVLQQNRAFKACCPAWLLDSYPRLPYGPGEEEEEEEEEDKEEEEEETSDVCSSSSSSSSSSSKDSSIEQKADVV